MKKLYYFIPLLMLTSACSNNNTKNAPVYEVNFKGEAQGTTYNITYFASDSIVGQRQVDSLLDAFNLCASIYEPASIISRFNKNDSTALADSLFKKIFNASMEVSRRTSGAFDITVGQLVTAWGFGLKNKEKINQKIIDSLLQFTGYQKIHLSENRLIKNDSPIMIDFNAIAQGFSVDLLGNFFESKGITNFLIEIGGELKGKGTKPGGSKWNVSVEKPSDSANSPKKQQVMVKIENLALATSGNYRKYIEENGIRYSHIIDPSSGYPAKHNLLSVTVAAKDCTTADAYATAFMVMGMEKAKEFLKQNKDLGLDVYFIYSDQNNKMQVYTSEGFRKLIAGN
jgi:thiamine biosynthesis lipoprotein